MNNISINAKEHFFCSTSLKRSFALRITLLLLVMITTQLRAENMNREIENRNNTLTESQQQQKKNITGIIVDAAGVPVIGANIIEVGTTNGTVTDADGKFSLMVDNNARIRVTYIGYVEQLIDTKWKNNFEIRLLEDTQALEELVVIGYGTVKKKDLTGSVSSVSPRDFRAQPVQGISEMIADRVAGVMVTQTNGDASASTKIRIRGSNSLNGSNDPLYIVDGVPMGSYSPSDVESIEVLKDASATAIYGSRGANGVVLITTKRGSTGGPYAEVVANTSFATYPKFYDLLDGKEFGVFYNQYFGTNLVFPEYNTDWQKVLTQTGIRQNYQANISGGTDKMNFYVGGNYIHNQGTIKNNDSENYRLRSNFDFKLGSRFSGKVDLSVGQSRSHNSNEFTSKGPLFSALQWSPCLPTIDENGNYTASDPYSTTYLNPYMEIMEANSNSYGTSVAVNGHFAYQVIEGLKLSVQPAINRSLSEGRSFSNSMISSGGDVTASRSMGNSTSWQITSLATYDKTFNMKHNLNAMLGSELYKSEYYGFSARGQKFFDEKVLWNNLGSATTQTISSSYSSEALASFFTRANYNYDSRYYVTASLRADGSSKFRGDNQFSYFPSGALSWVASNEEFLKDHTWIDHLKFRLSYGVTGSQAIGPYATVSSLGNSNWGWGAGDSKLPGVYLTDPANPNLKWEETTQWNLGVDANIFEKWSIGLDYFNKTTDGLLTNRVLPSYTGGGSTRINLGQMKNHGIDASITFTPFNHQDFSWRMTLNGSWLQNRVASLGDLGEYFIPSGDANYTGVQLETSPLIVQQGQPLGQLYGFKWLGLWKESEAEEAAKYNQKPGDNRYLDKNNDYSYSNEDKEVIGNFMPKFIWSYNSTINWKNFDFNLLVEGAHNRDMYNFNRMVAGTIVATSFSVTLREAADNMWTASNQETMWAPRSSSALEKPNSSKWVEEASWVKIRNLSIGYTIPKQLLCGHEIRVNASAQNLFTITGYSGLDPESQVNGAYSQDFFGGVEYGTYPQSRIYTIGLTYKF